MTDPASRSTDLNALLHALHAARRGDLTARLSAPEGDPVMSEIALAFNAMVEQARVAEQVAQASRYKSEFLAHMSHELRTPLNSLLVLARLLADNQEGTLSPRQVEYARTIYDAGGDLLALITEILDHARIEAGQMRIEAHDVELDEIRGLVERTFTQVAAQRGLSFAIDVAPDAPTRLHTDAQRLQQVLLNLLSNAFKFTERGGVTLRIARDAANSALTFSVRDTGIGIDPERHTRIFQPFQQADGSTARRYGGTGLGLSISRGIAELLGGTLVVESAPGAGSTFTLTLPLHEERDAPEQDVARYEWIAPKEPSSPPPPDTTLAGRKALVIDDDVRNIFSLASLLESQSMQIVFAEGGREGLDALWRTPDIDVVLMDVMMPDLDGYAAMRMIRDDPRYTTLPLIAVTARALPGDRVRCLDAGASEYLTKPLDTTELLAVIRRLLAR